jgi:hypothetical protein
MLRLRYFCERGGLSSGEVVMPHGFSAGDVYLAPARPPLRHANKYKMLT